jgi:hypothetical protein
VTHNYKNKGSSTVPKSGTVPEALTQPLDTDADEIKMQTRKKITNKRIWKIEHIEMRIINRKYIEIIRINTGKYVLIGRIGRGPDKYHHTIGEYNIGIRKK